MIPSRLVLSACMSAACFFAFPHQVLAQAENTAPTRTPQGSTAYEELVYENASQFHKNFSRHEWEKNAPLVADSFHANSNGTKVSGRDEFIKRIARFAIPFPDVKITDVDTIVAGNKAAIRFVITGTHTGDLPTPDGILHATNRKIHVDGVDFFTFNQEGKLVDLLTVEDVLGMMRQLTSTE